MLTKQKLCFGQLSFLPTANRPIVFVGYKISVSIINKTMSLSIHSGF